MPARSPSCELLRTDRAADKAIARYAALADFTLVVVLERDDTASFSTNEMHSVAGGTLVMRPAPYSGASTSYDLRVNSRPIRRWNRQEEDPRSESRVEIALPKAPEIEGCDIAATGRCGLGTHIRARGVDLTLHADFLVALSAERLELRAMEPAPAAQDDAD